ncbi:MAG: carbohydrate-binding protein, partial [Bacteroidota bacterium]
MQIINSNGDATTLHTVSFPSTGGWQTWTTTNTTAFLYAGQYHIRVTITKPLFNMNWIDFTYLTTATQETASLEGLSVNPNPGYSLFTLKATLTEKQTVEMQVVDMLGQPIISKSLRSCKHAHIYSYSSATSLMTVCDL